MAYGPEPMREPDKELKNWLVILHLSPLAGLIGIPFVNVVAPLVIWLMKKEESPEIDRHGKEVLNFQISLMIYFLISAILVIIAIGFVLAILVGLFGLAMIIMGAIDASNGKLRRYPATIRFIQ